MEVLGACSRRREGGGNGGGKGGEEEEEEEEVVCETYVWTDPVERLEGGEWDVETFLREKLAVWTGERREYEDVDEAVRGLAGTGTGTGTVDPMGGRGFGRMEGEVLGSAV